jgi:hypothetical protein
MSEIIIIRRVINGEFTKGCVRDFGLIWFGDAQQEKRVESGERD